jgi:hypothetical protein
MLSLPYSSHGLPCQTPGTKDLMVKILKKQPLLRMENMRETNGKAPGVWGFFVGIFYV